MADFELRELRSDDVFPMLRVIKAIGVRKFSTMLDNKAIMNAVMNKGKKGFDLLEVGLPAAIDIAAIVIENLPNAEKEIFAFLGRLSGKSEQELREGSFTLLPEMIVALFQKKEFSDFFTVVTGLLKSGK